MKRHFLAAAILLILSFSIYAPSLFYPFVYPDTIHIAQNRFITDASYISMYFSSDFYVAGNFGGWVPYYRPLFPLSFLIDYKIWGMDPMGFRLTNILYHGFSVISLYILCMILFNDRRFAFLSSILFALHPIHTEAVDWISGRPDAQAGLFYILSFVFYLSARRSPGRTNILLGISSAAFFLSLLSKEMAVTLPFVLILYEIIHGSRFTVHSSRFKWGYILPFFLVLSIYFLMRYIAVGAFFGNYPPQIITDIPPDSGDVFVRLMTALNITVSYLRLLILPVDLKTIYAVPIPNSLFDAGMLISIVVIVLIFAILIPAYYRSKMVFFWTFFVLLTLSPVLLPLVISLNFAQTLMSERYLYIPSIGFCILAGMLLVKIFDKIHAGIIRMAIAVTVLFLITAYGLMTIQRHSAWKSEEAFLKSAAGASPDSALARYNLGLWHYANKQMKEAKAEFRQAFMLNKNKGAIAIASEEEFDSLFDETLTPEETLSTLRKAFILKQ